MELGSPGARKRLVMTLLLSDDAKRRMKERAPAFPSTLHQPGLLRRVARRAKSVVKAAVRAAPGAGLTILLCAYRSAP